MAGLGEACSHISALLFAVEATVKIRDSKTVTEEPAYWLLPSGIKSVPYSEVRNINFTSARTMKKKLDESIDSAAESDVTSKSSDHKRRKVIPEPTALELSALYKSLHETGRKPALLATLPNYSDDYVPAMVHENFPLVLTELYDEACVGANYSTILEKCRSIKLEVMPAQADCVEVATRKQHESKLWYRFRAGRITASKMKSVCSTDPNSPSQSLIKSICYPEESKFTSKETKWGRDHEKGAIAKFKEVIEDTHTNVKIKGKWLAYKY